MAADGTLSYAVTLANRGFLGPARRVNTAIGGMMGKMSRFAGPLAAASAAAAGLAGGIGGLGKAIRTAADFESTQVALRTLIGDVGKADKVLSDVRKLGKSTPFEFPELAAATRKLVSFGASADTVVDTMRKVGDVAAGAQSSIGEVAAIYGRAQVKGKLYAEEINQFLERGIPVTKEFAKILKVPQSEIFKMASEGKIQFSHLEQAFKNLTNEGGQFHNMMAAQSATTNGLLSTLRDNIGEVFLVIGQPINDALRPLLKQAIGLAQQVGAGMGAMVGIIKAAVAQGKLGEMIAGILEFGFKEGINSGVGAFTFIAAAAGRLLGFAIEQVFGGNYFQLVTGVWKEMPGMITGVGFIIRSELGGAFNEIVSVFQAGLQFGIQQAMAGFAKIPKLNKLLGLEDFEASSFDDLLKDFRSQNDPSALKAEGERILGESMGALADLLTDVGPKALGDLDKAMDGLDFESANVLDTAPLRDKLTELAKALSPEDFEKLIASVGGASKEIEEAAKAGADGIKKTAQAAQTSSTQAASASVKEVGDKAKEPKRRGLFNLAESRVRRFNRLSQADKDKKGLKTVEDFNKLSLLDSRKPSSLGKLTKGISANVANRTGTPIGKGIRQDEDAKAAAATNAKKTAQKTESKLVAVLNKIEANTALLDELVVA